LVSAPSASSHESAICTLVCTLACEARTIKQFEHTGQSPRCPNQRYIYTSIYKVCV
jgi:hypothetical protein